MSLKSILTSATISLVAAGSLLPMATAASARDYDRHGGGNRFERNAGPRHFRGDNHNRFSNRWDAPRRHHRNHNGRNLAIGAFATILGIAIASEIQRDRYDGYRD